MAQLCPGVDKLLPALQELERTVQAQAEESVSFRKWNTKFDKRNETTQLLLNVCEQLWNEKQTMEQSNFEEHASDLSYLCQHYKTSIKSGLALNVHADELQAMQKKGSIRNIGVAKQRRFCGLCCSSEFPPQQSWWTDIKQSLVPRFQVQRGGNLCHSTAMELVRGDVVFISAGQRAAADGRILVLSEGAAVDASHLTQRAHDVRLCSTRSTAVRPDESRNIILKGSYIISGSLFCMVVRSPREPLLPGTADSAQERLEPDLDGSVPANMTMNMCQGLFRALCTRARLFCKSFRAIESLAGVNVVVVTLTQELLSQGTIPKFVATMQKLRKAVVFVSCDCRKDDLRRVAQDLKLEISDFNRDGEKPPLVPGSSGESGDPRIEPMMATSIDLTMLSGPLSLERLAEHEQALLKRVLEKLQHDSVDQAAVGSAVLTGISQAALLLLCRTLSSHGRNVLFAVSNYHYPQSFRLLAEKPIKHRGLPGSVLGASEVSTGTDSHLHSPETPGAGLEGVPGIRRGVSASQDPTSPSNLQPPPSTPMAHHGTVASFADTQRTMMSFRSDPCRDLVDGGRAAPTSLSSTEVGSGGSRGLVFVSLNSIGIVSDYSSCILLKSDLACLGEALEIVSKKIRR